MLSVLVTVFAGSEDDRGEMNCGVSQTWTVAAGATKQCCTDSTKGAVNGYTYTVGTARGKGAYGNGFSL